MEATNMKCESRGGATDTSMAALPNFAYDSVFHLSIIPLIILLLWSVSTIKRKKLLSLPPGPPGLPIIGNLHQLSSKQPHLSLHRIAQKYGAIAHVWLGHVPTVVISSAELAKEAIKAHDLALTNRSQIYSAKHFFYDCTDIAFPPHGSYWRGVRKLCTRELFSSKRVESFARVRSEEVARLVRRIASSYPEPVNVSEKLELYVCDVVCRAAFGRIFSEGEYVSHGFHDMLTEFQIMLGGFSVGDFFPSMEWINLITGVKQRLVRTFKKFDALYDELIQQHLDSNKADSEEKDLLQILLEIQRDGTSDLRLTMDNIKAVMMDMFGPGTDSSYSTLDSAMTELTLKPRVLAKAQAEVRSVVGERQWVLETDIPNMHYLNAFMKEIFRLHPPVALIPRESSQEVVINGYKIPPKTRFFFNAWAIGRDPATYSDPEEFKPERFLGSSVDYRGVDFELIPFGVGRRMCPALLFAEVSVQLALAQLLHSFDWELPSGVEPKDLDLTEVFGITMHRVFQLNLIAKPRFQDHMD